jgi:DNA-binding transcriptional LysR family regulator
MEVDRLTMFRAVAREGGFTRAARKLHRTQPAVSQAIRTLEEELGERLFERLGRETALTPAGRAYLEHVDEAFEALERGRDRLASLRELMEGELLLGASDTTACYVLPPAIEAFRARHPAVELRIANRPSPVTLEQVASREVELGFVTLPLSHPRLTLERWMDLEDVVIVQPEHPLASRRRLRLEHLAEHPMLLLDRGSRSRSFIDERFARAGVEPRIAMELASIEVIKRLVELGLGVSIVPAIAVADEVAAGRLAARPIFARREQRALGVAYREAGALSRPASAFLEVARPLLRRAQGQR